FFSRRRRHTRFSRDWSSDVCSSDLQLSDERPVIFFDQLGCGRSDRITDTTLMTINAHIDQIARLLQFLDVDEFYLYGHSWGSMLGMDYYLRHGDDLKALVLSGPCLDAKRWVADADTLIAQLPDSSRIRSEEHTSELQSRE